MKLSKIKVSALSITIPVISLLLLASMNVAVGQTGDIPGVQRVGPTTVGGLVDILRNVVRWVYIIFFVLAVMWILLAAFNYLTAGGEAEKITKAKNMLIYAAVAIVVALLAVGFETIIRNFLAAPSA